MKNQMKDPVLLKGNHFGLTIVLDSDMEFQVLKQMIGDKFKQAKDFFNSERQIAVKIEGRKLSTSQIEEIMEVISENSSLAIAYVMEDDKFVDVSFQKAAEQLIQLKQKEQERTSNTCDGQFYKGTLRSGQCLESDASVVVVGDVNPGATVMAKGNVVILGCAKGYIYAGTDGDERAFIAALDMQPMQVRIGNLIARCSDEEKEKKKKKFRKAKQETQSMETQIAFVEDGNIYIEPISKALLSEISV